MPSKRKACAGKERCNEKLHKSSRYEMGMQKSYCDLAKISAKSNGVLECSLSGMKFLRQYPSSFLGKKVVEHWERGRPANEAYNEIFGGKNGNETKKFSVMSFGILGYPMIFFLKNGVETFSNTK